MTGVDGADDDRIEIELTPTERPAEPRRQSPLESAPEPAANDDLEPDRERTTLPNAQVAALVVAVGLGALALGWALRGDDDGASADARSPSTVDADDANDTDADDSDDTAGSTELPAVETLPPAEIESPATPPRRTTTTLPAAETTTIEVAPEVAQLPVELVGTEGDGTLVTLDLPSGAMVQRPDTGINGSTGGPPRIAAGPGWVLLPDWNQDRSVLIEDGADPVAVDLGPPWLLVEAATTGQFWRIDDQALSGRPRDAELIDRFGEPVGDPLPIDSASILADPAGGVVVTTTGGTYSVTTDGATRIVDGDVLAIGADRALARHCDEQLACRHVVVDRSTGDMRPIEIDADFGRADNYYFGGGDVRTIGPDGRTAAVAWITSTGTPMVSLVDLETGTVTDLSNFSETVLRWSPDGRFAFYLEVGLPMAHDLATGESYVIADDLPRLDRLALRPSTSDEAAEVAPTTTAAPPTFETAAVAVAPALHDQRFELIGSTYGAPGTVGSGAVITLDVGAGEMTVRRDAGLSTTSVVSSELWAGPGWAVLATVGNDARTVLLEGDAAPVDVDLGASGDLVAASTPGEFWRSAARVRLGMPGDVQLVDRHGEPIGEPLSIAQSSRLADPTGGLVIPTTDGSFSVAADGTDKIADGTVIALNAERAFARQCDEQLRCRHVVIDRTTGAQATLKLADLEPTVNFVTGGGDTNTFAPDGRTVALAWIDDTSPDPQLGLIDLDTAELTRLTTSGDTTLRWSPDGRFALFLDAGRLMAHDLTAEDTFVVAGDLPLLSGIAIRPASTDPATG